MGRAMVARNKPVKLTAVGPKSRTIFAFAVSFLIFYSFSFGFVLSTILILLAWLFVFFNSHQVLTSQLIIFILGVEYKLHRVLMMTFDLFMALSVFLFFSFS